MRHTCTFVLLVVALGGCFPGPIDDPDTGLGDTVATASDTTGSDTFDDGETVLEELSPPENVTATTDRASEVAVTWQAGAQALRYRVFRCEGSPCGSAWVELTSEPIAEASFVDESVATAALPAAPGSVMASTDRATDVEVSWTAAVTSTSPRYRYRVVALEGARESEPSADVEGTTAERPVTGYEVQVDDGAWSPASIGSTTTWTDTNAPAPTLSTPAVSASQGTYAEYVRLAATGVGAVDGASREYCVRATTAYGPGPASAAATGRRSAGALTLQWERSVAATNASFVELAGAEEATHDDTSAPVDGATRWYRLRVGAAGAATVTSAAVVGSRRPPPGIPANVVATSDLLDRVVVTWSAVPGAIGYHVERDGVRLTSGTGISATTLTDFEADAPDGDWTAPTELVASSDDPLAINLAWVAPTHPLGDEAVYRVLAVNAAGDGPLSAEAPGRRAAPALSELEVEVDGTWRSTGSTATTWSDTSAPAGHVEGEVFASRGDHRGYVRLTSIAGAFPGADVTYRVRGRLDGGGTTPIANAAIGRRAMGALTFNWERSLDDTATAFEAVSEGVTELDDADAPDDGSKRWYRLRLEADGTEPLTIDAQGWRLAFVTVDAGAGFACGLSSAGRVWCWGQNKFGQLGRGTVFFGALLAAPIAHPDSVSEFTQIAVGGGHTCALAADGGVWCWGINTSGAIGDGTTGASQANPTHVGALPGVATSVGAGTGFSCAIVARKIHCWGQNAAGQLGDGSNTNSYTPTVVVSGASTPLVDVISIEAGDSHVCARKSSGGPFSVPTLHCWGANASGQLGDGTTTPSNRAIASMGSGGNGLTAGGSHTCAIDYLEVIATGLRHTRCWGSNEDGQIGDGTVEARPEPAAVQTSLQHVRLAATNATSCGLSTLGVIQCWGSNAFGALGSGSLEESSGLPVVVQLGEATWIGAGSEHFCAIKSHDVYCWGRNEGRLGDGTELDRSVPTAVLLP